MAEGEYIWNGTSWDPELLLTPEQPIVCECHNITNITDPCLEGIDPDAFNLGLHIGGIFIILAASLAGVLLPLILSCGKTPDWVKRLLYFGKFFGSGVILSTGFVHIFPAACLLLQQPCLPAWFAEDYLAAPGLFAMLGVLGMHCLEMGSEYFLHKWSSKKHVEPEGGEGEETEKKPNHNDDVEDEEEHTHTLLLMSDQSNWATALLLEFGISVHSVIIGISLGTSTDEFVALLIALCFHQFFEGIGLGHVLAEAELSSKGKDRKYSRLYAFCSGLFYALTTPVGVAIGIGISSSTSTATIIATGILDSISSGILIYSALISLISVVFQTRKFKNQPVWQKSLCFFSFYTGAAFMSVLAIWA